MAATPEDTPIFDFGPIRTYSPEVVAARVIWPVINELWRGDWQTETRDGNEFHFPKRGTFDGRLYDIELEAEANDQARGDEVEKKMLYSASLYIEEEVKGIGRAIMLAAAKAGAEEHAADEDEDEEDADPERWLWPEGDEDLFIARNGVVYSFHTDGDSDIEFYRAIEGPQSTLNVPLTDDELARIEHGTFEVSDLERIGAACHVLKVSGAIHKALEDIKANPVTDLDLE